MPSKPGYTRRKCSVCGEGLGFSEGDPCDRHDEAAPLRVDEARSACHNMPILRGHCILCWQPATKTVVPAEPPERRLTDADLTVIAANPIGVSADTVLRLVDELRAVRADLIPAPSASYVVNCQRCGAVAELFPRVPAAPNQEDEEAARQIVEAELIDDEATPALLVPTAIINRLTKNIAAALAQVRRDTRRKINLCGNTTHCDTCAAAKDEQ